MPLNEDFLANPLMFLREKAVSPPDGMHGQLISEWTISNAGNIASGGNGINESTIRYVQGGPRVKFARFVAHPLFPGALSLRLADARTDAGEVPIHWLPWASLKITKTTIPEVPSNVVEAYEDENPRFFFTAGINGCSVFVKGPPTKPTVFHAGITGKLAREAGQFWREQLERATRGTHLYLEQTLAEVDKSQYMDKDSQTVRDYIKWAQSGGHHPFTVEVVNNFGCVFGIRFGRYWSFYLQEAALIETAKFVQREEVDRQTAGGQKTYTERATGFSVKKQTISTPRRLGPIPLPSKKTRIYASTNQRCVAFRVSEIFPNRHWSGEIKDVIRSHVM